MGLCFSCMESEVALGSLAVLLPCVSLDGFLVVLTDFRSHETLNGTWRLFHSKLKSRNTYRMRSEGTQPRAGQAAEHEQAAANGSKCAGVRRVLGDAVSELSQT